MARLVTCKDCGNEVSKRAKLCPNCGAPKPKKTSLFTKSVAITIAVITIIAVFGALTGPEPSSVPRSTRTQLPTSKPATTAQSQSLRDRMRADPSKPEVWLISQQERFAEAKLKDPSSAQFRNSYISFNKDVAVVCGEVNAKNSYGAYGGYQRYVAAGNVHVTEDDMTAQEFQKLWSQVCSNRL